MATILETDIALKYNSYNWQPSKMADVSLQKITLKGFEVWKLAFISRVLLIIFQVVFHLLIPDHNADAFRSPLYTNQDNSTLLDYGVQYLLSGFSRWDAQYFLHIATLGYTHENCVAFFPLYPALTGFFSKILSFVLGNQLNSWNANLLTGVLFNTLLFSYAAKYLFLVTVEIFKDVSFAYRTATFFVLSPAGIFFSAPYSESLFCCLTFAGIYYCLKKQFILAALSFGLSTATRSNGLLNAGFLLYYITLGLNESIIISLFQSNHIHNILRLPLLICSIVLVFVVSLFRHFKQVALYAPIIVFSVVPFFAFQYFVYKEFCELRPFQIPETVRNFLIFNKFVIRGNEVPEWCNSLMLSYSYVQSKYWDVGFLTYYQFKQWPNFILASPALLITLTYFILFIVYDPHVCHVKKLRPILDMKCLPYVLHSTSLAIFSLLFIHIQVSTRLLCSSSPVMYWIAACWSDLNILPSIRLNSLCRCIREDSVLGKLIISYSVSYILIGTALFVNFLPWT